MKKTIGFILIVAVMLLVFAGGVFAVPQQAIDNSAACAHVPVPATNNANPGSVVGSCSGGSPG